MTGLRLPNEELCRALAYGFLAAEGWTQGSLEAAGRRTLGRWHRWLRPLVGQVRDAYRAVPEDRPHELARFIAVSEFFPAGFDHPDDGPLTVAHLIAAPTRMGHSPWPVPPVDTVDALAKRLQILPEHLAWMADPQGRQLRTAAGPYHLYDYRWVSRAGAVPRLLEAPTPLLRGTLRRLLTEILDRVPSHPAAHGFVRGRSAVTNAGEHVGAEVVISMDLRHFFAAITAGRAYGLFRMMGYPEPVAHSLAGLVSNRVPGRVLARMPPGGDPSARHRLRAWLRASHLPQGAPTSPSLANLVCFTLDARLAGYAAAIGARYSRYADDLTVSGSAELRSCARRCVGAVTSIAAEEGFVVHSRKTRVQPRSGRQQVTGIVVNSRLGLPRAEFDRLRAILHDALSNGPETANREGHPEFRAHLFGRVGWVESVNPGRGRRLRAQLEAIAWPDP